MVKKRRRTKIARPEVVRQFAERLREVRRAAGLTQRELAEAASMSEGYVARLEAGDTSPRPRPDVPAGRRPVRAADRPAPRRGRPGPSRRPPRACPLAVRGSHLVRRPGHPGAADLRARASAKALTLYDILSLPTPQPAALRPRIPVVPSRPAPHRAPLGSAVGGGSTGPPGRRPRRGTQTRPATGRTGPPLGGPLASDAAPLDPGRSPTAAVFKVFRFRRAGRLQWLPRRCAWRVPASSRVAEESWVMEAHLRLVLPPGGLAVLLAALQAKREEVWRALSDPSADDRDTKRAVTLRVAILERVASKSGATLSFGRRSDQVLDPHCPACDQRLQRPGAGGHGTPPSRTQAGRIRRNALRTGSQAVGRADARSAAERVGGVARPEAVAVRPLSPFGENKHPQAKGFR
jgi:DNA-binding XRE family transcriptional regulator